MFAIIAKEIADEKVAQGWLRAWLAFEALAVSEEVARVALAELIEKLDADSRVKIYKKDFGEFIRREKPLKGIEVGWSGTAEIELVTKDLDSLVQVVMQYGPSSVELLAPAKLTLDAGEAQSILNGMAAMMHAFAQAGLGGIVFVRGKE